MCSHRAIGITSEELTWAICVQTIQQMDAIAATNIQVVAPSIHTHG